MDLYLVGIELVSLGVGVLEELKIHELTLGNGKLVGSQESQYELLFSFQVRLLSETYIFFDIEFEKLLFRGFQQIRGISDLLVALELVDKLLFELV